MNANQAKCFLFAQAEMARVAGMQAENQRREYRGEAQAYSDDDFNLAAGRIEALAIELINN